MFLSKLSSINKIEKVTYIAIYVDCEALGCVTFFDSRYYIISVNVMNSRALKIDLFHENG